MARIRPDDRAALEALYPPDAFRRDALRNGVQNASVLQGLRILSDPGPGGAVEIAQGEQNASERDVSDGSFLAPVLSGDDPNADPTDDRPYRSFLDGVMAALRRRKPVDASSDDKLAGFHGG